MLASEQPQQSLIANAPTDDAFSQLSSRTSESLLEDILQLRKMWEYHVVSAKAMTVEAVKLDESDYNGRSNH